MLKSFTNTQVTEVDNMLDKDSPISLYNQLINILVNDIKNNLKPHSKMLSEREICTKYNISRTTVRQALQELENIGYIYKVSGKGTFVSNTSIIRKNLIDSYSFTEQMHAIGKVPKTEVLSFEIVESYAEIAQQMNINSGDEVYFLRRLRLADGVPMMVETSYLPLKIFYNLEEELVKSKPLYDIFKNDYGEDIAFADEEFAAGLVKAKVAKLLDVQTNSPCLNLKRTTVNKKNQVLELTFSTTRSDQFVYKIRHTRYSK